MFSTLQHASAQSQVQITNHFQLFYFRQEWFTLQVMALLMKKYMAAPQQTVDKMMNNKGTGIIRSP